MRGGKEFVVRTRIDLQTKKKASSVLERNGLTLSFALRKALTLVAEGDLSWLDREFTAKKKTVKKTRRNVSQNDIKTVEELLNELA
jgi:RelB antitoxin.